MSMDRRTFVTGTAAVAASGFAGTAALAQEAPTPPATARRGFGWVRDLPNASARLLSPPFTSQVTRPRSKDLSGSLPDPYDQGSVGSCTANAIAGAVQYARRAHSKPGDFVPSRLFIYYYERLTEGNVYTDSGAQLQHGIKAVVDRGVPSEASWRYEDVPGDPTTHVFPAGCRAVTQPDAAVAAEAAKYRTISYAPLKQDVATLESCIASGYPFVFGFTVYDNLTERTTLLRKPGPADHVTPYGHAVLATGYDQAKRTFKIRNSWGTSCHSHGYFEMDYDYVLNSDYASDFWVVYQTLGFMGD